jgi:hypothetical protein
MMISGMKWAVHLAHIEGKRNADTILDRKLEEREDNTKNNLTKMGPKI